MTRPIPSTVRLWPLLAVLAFVFSPLRAHAAPPPDRPHDLSPQQIANENAAIAPYVSQARASYPDAKRRFLAGLGGGQRFFVTARIGDRTGKWEQVFVAVKGIRDGTISGSVASQIKLLEGVRLGDPCSVPEGAILDWLIVKADGTEEGNFVGKFLDTYHK